MTHFLLLLLLAACPGSSDDDEDEDEDGWSGTKPITGVDDTGTYCCEEEDGDGYTSADGDCDDNDPYVNPGAAELCNGRDDDCDGEIDEGVTEQFYADADGDGFGDPSAVAEGCEPPRGYVVNGSDCDDSSAASYPGNVELCDAVDNDCDGLLDEDGGTFYADADGDGFGDASVTTTGCGATAGYVANANDCDDTDATSYPGATEACDAADNDCDNEVDEDGCR